MGIRFAGFFPCYAQRANQSTTILSAVAYMDGMVWHERIGHSIVEHSAESVFYLVDLLFLCTTFQPGNCLPCGNLSNHLDVSDLLRARGALFFAAGEYSAVS